MVICPQCSIEHDPGEEFCRKCGKFLLTVEDPPPEEEKTKVKFVCPRCQLLYQKGNYCRKCGSLLMRRTSSQETFVQPLEKKSVKSWAKEWRRLSKEEKELESCISKLETQRDQISSDVLNPVFIRYKDRLESLSPLHQEVETELERIKKRALHEIDFLENELRPIQKRLEEFQSLHKLSAIKKTDFVREKKELGREIRSRERGLKKHRQLLSLLPDKIRGDIASSGSTGNFVRPATVIAAILIMIPIIAGAYFVWPRLSPSSTPVPKEMVTHPSPPPPPPNPNAATEESEAEKIRSLFENIKQANLKKNIDLFMSCYSRDFTDREGKRLDALDTWGFFNYLDLSYDLKKQTISGDTAHVRLEWLIRIIKKTGGKQEERRTLLDATLKKEDGHWKIKEIKAIS
jgi:ketosteroid isomerase-like protein/DNA-directed RNA polymerase subunit M/transcription elongation factor TFIIS